MFFSPDSLWLGFFDPRARALKKMNIGGGPAVIIAPLPAMNAASGATMTRSCSPKPPPARPVSSARGGRGTPKSCSRPKGTKVKRNSDSRVLPGSRAMLFASIHGADPRLVQVSVLDLRTVPRKTLIQGASPRAICPAATCCSPGTTRSWRCRSIPGGWRSAGRRGRCRKGSASNRTPRPITACRTPARWFTRPAAPPPSRGARCGSAATAATSASVDPRPISKPTFPRISPDGRRLALNVGGDLWVYDLDGCPPIKLAFDAASFTAALVCRMASGSSMKTVNGDAGIGPGRRQHEHSRNPVARRDISIPLGWLAGGDRGNRRAIGYQTVADLVRFAPDGEAGDASRLSDRGGGRERGRSGGVPGRQMDRVYQRCDRATRGSGSACTRARARRRGCPPTAAPSPWSRNGRELVFP